MENYIISVILAIFESLLIILFRRNYKVQDRRLEEQDKKFNAFGKLLLLLKIQNIATNFALEKEFKNGFMKTYDKMLKKLMEQENFTKE